MRNLKLKSGFLYVIISLSGFAGLGYEMVWTRMLGIGLGHEVISVLAVVGALFCGMALGAWRLDTRVSQSPRPGRWYAFLELGIGLWSLVLVLLIPWAHPFGAAFIGVDPSMLRHWSVAFALPFLLLLPATFAMGATLPAMERFFSRLRQNGWSIGGIYAANTFGAVLGILMTTFVIAPAVGFRTTAVILSMVNFTCALAVISGPARSERQRPPVPTQHATSQGSPRIFATLFLTGLLGIGYEVLVVRVASQLLENTVYSFAGLLAVYLTGTAFGAAIYQKFAVRRHDDIVLTCLLQCLALFCLVSIAMLPFSERLFLSMRGIAGGGMSGSIAAETGFAAVVLFFPTVLMGAIFSHLAQSARSASGGIGRAISMNTLGASLAPVTFGVILLPTIGAKLSLVAVSLGYLCLIPSRRWKLWIPTAIPVSLVVIILSAPAGFNFITLTPGSRIVTHMEGVMAAVSVIKDSRKDTYLKVNNKFVMGGTASRFSDWSQGHIPLLLHQNPKTALFLGLGTGATFAASADYPELASHGVELVPEVVNVLPYFEKATGPIAHNPRLRIHVADARRFVNSCSQSFDVIVADLFHPARDGAGFLYTVEHFQAIKALMNPGGVFCQWLPLYQMDLDVLRTIIRTFMHVFPDGRGFIATYSLKTPIVGLVSNGGHNVRYPTDYMNKRITGPLLARKLASLRLDSNYTLFGNFIAGPRELIDFAGPGLLNTDDRPLIIFKAPQFAYTGNAPAYERLFALLDTSHPEPDQILKSARTAEERAVHNRLKAYWAARNRFLHAGVGVNQTVSLEKMLDQVKNPLLAIVRESPDFEAAYDPLLAMAHQLYETNPDAAQRLLRELEEVNPLRQEARQLRKHYRN